jgi:hypothetical protein
MVRRHRSTHGTRGLATAALVSLGALAGLVSAAPARADLPLPHEIHREVRAHVHDVLRHLLYVPDRIERHHRQHLEVFFGGRDYYRPHRHDHSTYFFPVWVGEEVEYRPYVYCDDRLFQTVQYRQPRPRIWRDWGHDRDGAWCARHRGYFPRQYHGCFRHDRVVRHSAPRYDHRGHRDHRYDRGRAPHRHHAGCGHDRRHWDRDDDRRDRKWERHDRRHH